MGDSIDEANKRLDELIKLHKPGGTYINIRDYVLVFISISATLLANAYISNPNGFGQASIFTLLIYFIPGFIGVMLAFGFVESGYRLNKELQELRTELKRNKLQETKYGKHLTLSNIIKYSVIILTILSFVFALFAFLSDMDTRREISEVKNMTKDIHEAVVVNFPMYNLALIFFIVAVSLLIATLLVQKKRQKT